MVIDLCLMHKDTKVLYFTADITGENCYITDIGNILSPINCPEVILNSTDKKMALRIWWKLRCMPETRRDFTNLITMFYNEPLTKKHSIQDSIFLISLFSYVQNIKDHYWINPAIEYSVKFSKMSEKLSGKKLIPTTYDEINLYKNPPKDDEIVKLILDHGQQFYTLNNYLSPNICVHGDKIKFWEYNEEEGIYYLYKYLHGIDELQKNEFKVYKYIMEEDPSLASEPFLIKKNLSDYGLSNGRDTYKTFVAYKNFITEDTELITGDDILLAQGLQKGDPYEIFYENCQYLGVPISFVDQVIEMSDELDRHFKMEEDVEFDNIGFIRDCKTKKFIKPAPIFGNSYFKSIM